MKWKKFRDAENKISFDTLDFQNVSHLDVLFYLSNLKVSQFTYFCILKNCLSYFTRNIITFTDWLIHNH